MEDKLQLKHLACYLPYGLTLQLDGKVKELVGLEAPYKTNNNYFIHGIVREIGGTYRHTQSMCLTEKTVHLCKPLLIPMSELKKEQWIKVFKAATGFDIEILNIDPTSVHCSFNGTMYGHYYFDDCEFRSTQTFNQLAAFDTLFSLHADIHGLIEKGLALSKIEHGR